MTLRQRQFAGIKQLVSRHKYPLGFMRVLINLCDNEA